MKITLKEAVDNFRKQWNWMADETLRQKRTINSFEYFAVHGIEAQNIPINDCYMCAIRTPTEGCDSCPIKWGGYLNHCYSREIHSEGDGLYAKYNNTTDYIEAANLAREIANLPLKEQYQTKQYILRSFTPEPTALPIYRITTF